METRYLVYLSRLVDPMGPGAVAGIIRESRGNNAIRGLTGALMFDGERFCQYLEGPADEIMRTFTAIQHDARHAAIELLASGSARERRFASWSMAYVYAVTPTLIDEIGGGGIRGVADAFASALVHCDGDL